jgi:membrane-associated phospholipid phosphatase
MLRFGTLLFACVLAASELSGQVNSPFNLKTSIDVPLSIAGGLAVGGGIYTSRLHEKKWLLTDAQIRNLDVSNVSRFDKCAINYSYNISGARTADRLSDGFLFGSVLASLGTSLITLPAISEQGKDRTTNLVMFLQVGALNIGVNGIVKNLVHRTRPFVYNKKAYPDSLTLRNATGRNYGDANLSFYSGHTSTTASFSFFTADLLASQVSKQSDKIIIWSSAALIPAFTGFLRVKAGKHFPTDVIVGYVVGAGIGWGVAELHKL